MEPIDPRHLLVKIGEILERLEIPYLITGGIAVAVWGRPRFTADIDIVVELAKSQAEQLMAELKQLSPAGYLDSAQVERALAVAGEFNFVDGTTGVEVDFWMLRVDDTFDQSRLKRRVAKEILGRTVYFTSPEDLILIKLRWYRDTQSSRQWEDTESILKISGNNLDMPYLTEWAEKLEVPEFLNDLMRR